MRCYVILLLQYPMRGKWVCDIFLQFRTLEYIDTVLPSILTTKVV